MGRRYILANTLTWHFIYFAKLMGIYPKIRALYKEVGKISKEMYLDYAEDIQFYNRHSFYNFVDLHLRFERCFLNESFIRRTYFFGGYGYTKFTETEIDELIELFFSYLKDKKIYKNIRIDRS